MELFGSKSKPVGSTPLSQSPAQSSGHEASGNSDNAVNQSESQKPSNALNLTRPVIKAVARGGKGVFDVATLDLSQLPPFRKHAPESPTSSQTQVESTELAKQYTPWVVFKRIKDLAWAECGSDLVKRGIAVTAGAILPYYIAVKSSALADLLKQPPNDPIAGMTALDTQLAHIAVGTGLLMVSTLAASRLTSRFRLQMNEVLTRELTDVPHLSQDAIESEKTKKLVSSVTWSKGEVIDFIQGSFSTAKDALSCVCGLGVLAWNAPRVWYVPWAAVLMTGVGITFSLTKRRSAVDTVETSDATNDTRQRLNLRQMYSSFPDAIRQIKLLGKVKQFGDKVTEPLSDVTEHDLALANRDAKRNSYVGSVSFFADTAIVATLAYQTMLKHLGAPGGIEFSTFVNACATLTLVRLSLERLRESLGEQLRTGIFARRFLLLTDLALLTELPFDTSHPPSIQFRDVCYCHPHTRPEDVADDSAGREPDGTRKKALSNISLTFKPGELVAICGDTGSGKTTLFDLLAKVREPESGGVYVQGHDLRTIPGKLWTNFISIHVQNFQLFQSLTLAENARMGANDDSQIGFHEAAEKVGASFIKDKNLQETATWGPDFEGGVFASGGQQQQLALLRTASKHPRVLIVDEPTSALGPQETEKFIRYIKDVHNSGATVIISAHNYNLFRTLNPDRIVVMKKGELEIQGTHDELMGTQNTYSDNFRSFQGDAANG
jgi:ABC-type multidrug transport system fused ATPase/permease subunit